MPSFTVRTWNAWRKAYLSGDFYSMDGAVDIIQASGLTPCHKKLNVNPLTIKTNFENNPCGITYIDTLPKVVRKELNPLDEAAITRFMEAIKGHRFELVFLVTLFTGMRQGEVLGLRRL